MIKETVRYDEINDRLEVDRQQDCTAILESCKQLAENLQYVDGLGYHVARIPQMVFEKYMKDNGVSYQELMNGESHIQKILNDPDFKKLRIWGGRV